MKYIIQYNRYEESFYTKSIRCVGVVLLLFGSANLALFPLLAAPIHNLFYPRRAGNMQISLYLISVAYTCLLTTLMLVAAYNCLKKTPPKITLMIYWSYLAIFYYLCCILYDTIIIQNAQNNKIGFIASILISTITAFGHWFRHAELPVTILLLFARKKGREPI